MLRRRDITCALLWTSNRHKESGWDFLPTPHLPTPSPNTPSPFMFNDKKKKTLWSQWHMLSPHCVLQTLSVNFFPSKKNLSQTSNCKPSQLMSVFMKQLAWSTTAPWEIPVSNKQSKRRWESSPGGALIGCHWAHRRKSRWELLLAQSLKSPWNLATVCSWHVRKAPRAKLSTPPVSTRSGDIQNHLFLAVLSWKLKIFLIQKIWCHPNDVSIFIKAKLCRTILTLWEEISCYICCWVYYLECREISWVSLIQGCILPKNSLNLISLPLVTMRLCSPT